MGSEKPREYQARMLSLFPHRSQNEKTFRKWLALGMLEPDTISEDLSLSFPPSLDLLRRIIQRPKEGGPFRLGIDMDDVALYQSTLILQVALGNLWPQISVMSSKEEEQAGSEVREQLSRLADALGTCDARIRKAMSACGLFAVSSHRKQASMLGQAIQLATRPKTQSPDCITHCFTVSPSHRTKFKLIQVAEYRSAEHHVRIVKQERRKPRATLDGFVTRATPA